MAVQCSPVLSGMEEVRECAAGGRCGGDPVPESTWWSKQRPFAEVAKCERNQAERKMGGRQQLTNIQQARKTAADRESARRSFDSFRGECEKALPAVVPRWIEGRPQGGEEATSSFEGMKFLSLFGGVANPAKHFSQRGGTALVCDLDFSPKNDLSKFSVWNQFLAIVHLFHFVGIDLPCNTWSRARRAPPWSRMPKPLRDKQFIFGLPHLSEADSRKVQAANRMFFGAFRMIRKCLRLGLAGYLENPATSFVRHTPQIQRLLRDSRIQLVTLDMCMYSCQWKKPTRLLLWNMAPASFLRCHGTHCCSRTHKPHLQLSGISGKRFLTEQAQVYSHAFSKALINHFAS